MLPAIPIISKMIFPGDHTPVRKCILQDATISKNTQEKVRCLLVKFEDSLSSSSSNIYYTKLIEMDVETEPHLPPVVS